MTLSEAVRSSARAVFLSKKNGYALASPLLAQVQGAERPGTYGLVRSRTHSGLAASEPNSRSPQTIYSFRTSRCHQSLSRYSVIHNILGSSRVPSACLVSVWNHQACINKQLPESARERSCAGGLACVAATELPAGWASSVLMGGRANQPGTSHRQCLPGTPPTPTCCRQLGFLHHPHQGGPQGAPMQLVPHFAN